MASANGINMKKPELFGQVAIRMGFVKTKDIQKALKIQEERKKKGKKHKLIGLILLEMGALGTTELITVLQEMEAQRVLMYCLKEKV